MKMTTVMVMVVDDAGGSTSWGGGDEIGLFSGVIVADSRIRFSRVFCCKFDLGPFVKVAWFNSADQIDVGTAAGKGACDRTSAR